MISAQRTGRTPDRYVLSRERRPVGTVTLGRGMSGATLELGTTVYEIRAGADRGSYELLAVDRVVMATAERVHRRHWSVRTAEGTHLFRRGTFGTLESLTDADGRGLGRVARSGRGVSGVVSDDLPGMDVVAHAFVLTLVLMRRRRRRRIVTRTAAVSAAAR
ncbi:hypothetical protein [Pseudonocardia sp. KRD291]|uniref:hypothetical protein n=1 Tax=Pseudonocardia sp. KRD291 TaxID=2792007 RepID=UPI001C49DCBD|nr:hypothetical protein [Pseudonocardia sp. KRD291]MBW0102701.1 hypothetical protein [Pseudonocardia sp. KRD291]